MCIPRKKIFCEENTGRILKKIFYIFIFLEEDLAEEYYMFMQGTEVHYQYGADSL
jgi:hypothetical protein